MNRSIFEIRFWLCPVLVFLLFNPTYAAPAISAATSPTTQATAPATQPGRPGVESANLRAAGIESVLVGEFDKGFQKLHDAASASPDDKLASAAIGLINQYMQRRQRSKSERADEYEQAVERVRRSFLVADHLPKLAELKIERDLRREMEGVISACADAANSEELERAGDEEAVRLRQQAVKALAEAAAGLKRTRKLLRKDRSRYADTFLRLAHHLSSRLAECREAWTAVKMDSPKSRRAASKRLKELENALAEALVDVEAMVAKKPWRVAMMYGRQAKLLAVDKDRLAGQPWFRKLIADIEAGAKLAVDDARWYDALAAYNGLDELDPDNETYKDLAKTVRKHVRVLMLYGGNSTTRPAEKKSDNVETAWRELAVGVDAEMVRDAISQLDLYYVKAVDYRKVASGALMSIKVLAETPQVAETFGGLKNEAKRAKFLKAVDNQFDYINTRDNVDHMDLKLVLNSILSASERTVKISTQVLALEFTEGLLDELDRFSSMIWPSAVSDFRKQTMGHFYGVGIQITKEPGEPLKVVTPLADSPAFKAGVKTGDIIVAVNGRRTEKLSLNKLVRMITGRKGTKVTLTIKRPGELKLLAVAIIREEIRIHTVKGWRRKPDGDWDYTLDAENKIGYIRVTQFTDQTQAHLVEALKQIRAEGLTSLVLDLRSNPGGLLRAATDVANEFLRAGRIVSTKGRQTRRSEKKANPAGEFLNGDLVVLVNEYSASAAEIVSGAIKDWRRGIIVGERTFGKGSVQNVIPIRRHKAFLRLTTAYYYLPHGRLLHRQNGRKDWGVDPDVAVAVTPQQMKRWLDIRRRTDLIQDVDAEQLDSELTRQSDADFQLNTALLLLKLMKLQQVKLAA